MMNGERWKHLFDEYSKFEASRRVYSCYELTTMSVTLLLFVSHYQAALEIKVANVHNANSSLVWV